MSITENGMHYAIMCGDTVYDNIYHNGISYTDWDNDYGITECGFKVATFDVQTNHPLWEDQTNK